MMVKENAIIMRLKETLFAEACRLQLSAPIPILIPKTQKRVSNYADPLNEWLPE